MKNHMLFPLVLLVLLSACSGPDKVEKTPAPTLASKQESLLRIAKATEAAGDLDTALQLYRQVAEQNPDSTEAWIGQARLYQDAGKTDMAISAFEQALRQDPQNSDLLRQLANTLIYAGNSGQALTYLQTALENSPHDSRILNARAVALDMQGDYAAAQESFREALQYETGSKSYIENNLAMSYLLSGDYDKSIALLNKLVATNREDARLRQNLALAYGLSGDHKKALKLGLKDLPPDAAAENVDFYKAYSKRIGKHVGKLEPSAGITIPATPSIADKTPDTDNAVANGDATNIADDNKADDDFIIETD